MLILNIALFISFFVASAIALDAYGVIAEQEEIIRDYEELILKLEGELK